MSLDMMLDLLLISTGALIAAVMALCFVVAKEYDQQ
jgi:hypothetical protein